MYHRQKVSFRIWTRWEGHLRTKERVKAPKWSHVLLEFEENQYYYVRDVD